jgi:hypothetical protein
MQCSQMAAAAHHAVALCQCSFWLNLPDVKPFAAAALQLLLSCQDTVKEVMP